VIVGSIILCLKRFESGLILCNVFELAYLPEPETNRRI